MKIGVGVLIFVACCALILEGQNNHKLVGRANTAQCDTTAADCNSTKREDKFSPESREKAVIRWIPSSILVTVSPGAQQATAATFISSKNLRRISIHVSDELAGILQVIPASFDHIAKDQQITLMLVVAPGLEASVGSISGKVHFDTESAEDCDSDCDNNRRERLKRDDVLFEPLSITVNIWRRFVSGDLGIAVAVPPQWSVLSDQTTLSFFPLGATGDVFSEYSGDIILFVDDNPLNLSAEQFYDGQHQQDFFRDATTTTQFTLAGFSALRFSGITKAFMPGDVVVISLPGRFIRIVQANSSAVFDQIVQTFSPI
jgi:hypothetical protein